MVGFYIPKLNFMLIEIKTFHSLYITMSYHPYDNRQKVMYRQVILPPDVRLIKHSQGVGLEAQTNKQTSLRNCYVKLRKKASHKKSALFVLRKGSTICT